MNVRVEKKLFISGYGALMLKKDLRERSYQGLLIVMMMLLAEFCLFVAVGGVRVCCFCVEENFHVADIWREIMTNRDSLLYRRE